MRPSLFAAGCGLAFVCGLTSPGRSAVLRVEAAPGQAPYRSVQAALDAAQAGDTVRVGPGVYRERVRFVRGGRPGAPVALEGEPGAVIDGSTPVELAWQPAPDIGPGVYRAALGFFPFTVTADGRTLTTLDEKRTESDATPAPANGWSRILWREAFVKGVGPSGWDGVKALAMYRRAEKELLVRFRGELDPRTLTMTVAPREPVVLIDGADRCVVRGLVLRNSALGVLVQNSVGSVVERCQIDPADFGITLGPGSDRCTLRFNRISLHPYAGADPRAPGAWDNWQAMKVGGFYDRTGIAIGPSVGGHEIHDNEIHDHWDGISDYGNPPWGPQKDPPTDNTGLRVHHNYLHVLSDDGMETMGPGIDGRWHDNRIERTLCGFRIKAPQKGPLYLYRNLFFDNKEDFRNWGSGKQLHPGAVVWVYHNTSTSDAAITMNYGSTDRPVTTPGYHYFNNLFWCREWVAKHRRVPAPDWQGDHNVFVRVTPQTPRPWDPPADPAAVDARDQAWAAGIALAQQTGIDAHSAWIDGDGPGFTAASKRDVSLTAASPARGRGIDLATLRPEPLPGFAPGYFTGPRPDAGALQFGQPMPRLPRTPDEVKPVPAGFWP